MKVMICTPCGEDVKAEFAFSLAFMLSHTLLNNTTSETPIEMGILSVNFSNLLYSRHLLAQEALNREADYILWIDSDHSFEPDLLLRLLSHQKDIVGLAYSTRVCPQRRQNVIPWLDVWATDELVEVNELGFGTILTSTRIFKELSRPWFEFRWREDLGRYHGEDGIWCDKAREAGYQIWVDPVPSRTARHIGVFRYSLDLKADAKIAISQAGAVPATPDSADYSGVWTKPKGL